MKSSFSASVLVLEVNNFVMEVRSREVKRSMLRSFYGFELGGCAVGMFSARGSEKLK